MTIFKAFLVSLPAIAYIGLLLFLVVYIFAIMGVFLFAENKLVGPLSSEANFQNTGAALLILLSAATQ